MCLLTEETKGTNHKSPNARHHHASSSSSSSSSSAPSLASTDHTLSLSQPQDRSNGNGNNNCNYTHNNTNNIKNNANNEYNNTNSKSTVLRHPEAFPSLLVILLWSVLTYISKEFSLFLPKYQSKAGAKTFLPAAYQYDEEHTFFDNTILTWGTDYAICVIMLYAAYMCLHATKFTFVGSLPEGTFGCDEIDPLQSRSLRIKSSCLFLCYAISVFAGGYAHYTFTGGVEQLNTLAFRIWWSICVGSVTAAGGFMGACGSEICARMSRENSRSQDRGVSLLLFRLVHVHDFLWMIYGGFLTWVCIMGGMSYKRPACDIFVAGTSQFVPTVYCILAVMSVRWDDVREPGGRLVDMIGRVFRSMFYIGFALNAPLLPSYPCYIQYTSLSLGVVNAILHLNLTVAWGMQALSLRRFCQAFNLIDYNHDGGNGGGDGVTDDTLEKKDQ